MATVVVGVSGASGICLAHLAIDALTSAGHAVHLIMTRDALITAHHEMGQGFSSLERFVSSFSVEQQALISSHRNQDMMAPIASGSFRTDGMLIVPCSMTTLAAVATGLGDTLLRRAADVTLKERRKLVLCPRESPFSLIHLENMLRLTQAGAVVVPPVPAWYLLPKSVEEVNKTIVSRLLDQLGIYLDLSKRWGEPVSLS